MGVARSWGHSVGCGWFRFALVGAPNGFGADESGWPDLAAYADKTDKPGRIGAAGSASSRFWWPTA